MSIQQHHLQNLIIGFGMSSKIQFLTLATGKATALWKKFQKMKPNFSKIVYFFVTFSFLSDYFDMDSRDFDSDNLRNKANAERNLHKIWSTGTI